MTKGQIFALILFSPVVVPVALVTLVVKVSVETVKAVWRVA